MVPPPPNELSGFAADPAVGRAFVARQPVFDRRLRVYGYELLFRSGLEEAFPPGTDPDRATSQVLTASFLLFGARVLAGDRRMLVNFTPRLLREGVPRLFPPAQLVVEILETVQPAADIVAACRELRLNGYTVALDDYTPDSPLVSLLPHADLVKIDVQAVSPADQADLARDLLPRGLTLLAERVETAEAYEQARAAGFSLFQGFFFSRPRLLTSPDLQCLETNYLRILAALHKPDLDFREVEAVIRRDVALSYKLLRFLNSAALALPGRVESIQQALTLLGERGLRRWGSLILLSQLGGHKTEELARLSVIRALFLEALADPLGVPDLSEQLFLAGLFSLIDAFLDRPREAILAELPLPEPLQQALVTGHGRLGAALGLCHTYERAEWARFADGAAALGLNETWVPRAYLQAVEQATRLLRSG